MIYLDGVIVGLLLYAFGVIMWNLFCVWRNGYDPKSDTSKDNRQKHWDRKKRRDVPYTTTWEDRARWAWTWPLWVISSPIIIVIVLIALGINALDALSAKIEDHSRMVRKKRELANEETVTLIKA